MSRTSLPPSLPVLLLLLAAGCADGAAEDEGGPGAPDAIVFSDVRVEELSDTRAVIRFETDRPASCFVEHGPAADRLDRVATDPDMAEGVLETTHEVALEDLPPDSDWYFRPVVEDESGARSEGAVATFHTLPGAATGYLNAALVSRGTRVVAVSSNHGRGANDSAYGAEKALDGSMQTEWSSNGDGDAAFLEVELAAPRDLRQVGFRSRSMADGTSITHAIRVVVDGTAYGPFDTPDPAELYRFPIAHPSTASSVRLELVRTTGGNTGAKELELLVDPF